MSLENGFLLNGRYRIERTLGQGGMGAVYLATDESLGIQCAVKANLNLSPESERLFRREATLLASMRHPNLPRVTNHFVLGNEQYLVMDFVEGEDLKERLARDGALPEAEVLHWAAQICDALTYLHGLNPPIIHRDIKPANIKLTAAGEALLVDFGIAKASDPSQKTATASVALTPGFAPPEQYGLGRTAPATDQYALGATLYTLLTGHTPPDSMERLLGNTALVDPLQLRPDLSPRVAAALTRALEVKIDNRFESVAAFKAALLDQTTPLPATQLARPSNTIPTSSAAPTVLQQRGAPTLMVPGTAESLPPVRKSTSIGWIIAAGGGGLLLIVGALILGFAALSVFNSPAATRTPLPTQTPEASGNETTNAPLTPVAGAATETPTFAAPPTNTATPKPTAAPTMAGTPMGGGPRIAFISNRDGQYYQIYSMNPDGSDVKQLTSDPRNKWQPDWAFHGTQLTWSSDGTKLLYVAQGDTGLNLWLMNADGKNQIDLTQSSGDDYQPTWCGADQIAFTTNRIGGVPQIFVMSLGKKPRNISATHNSPREYDPTWYPDCQGLIFASLFNGPLALYRYRFDGSSFRPIRSESPDVADEPAISPDGTLLAYTRRSTSTNEIIVGPIDDRLNDQQLTTTLGNSEPQWSPDGKWVVFVSTRDQNREVYLMTVAGTGQTNLTNNPATDTDPVWQPVPTASP